MVERQVVELSAFSDPSVRNALVVFLVVVACFSIATHASARDRDVRVASILAENLLHDPSLASRSANEFPAPNRTTRPMHPARLGAMVFLLPIYLHQRVFTHQDGDVCTFIPSCSAYGSAAIRRYGLRGLIMVSDRLLRCHAGNDIYYPRQNGQAYDPLP